MGDNLLSKIQRNVDRATNMSSESSTRNRVDNDETTANMEYMLTRGLSRTKRDYNRSQTREGLKIRTQPVTGRTVTRRSGR